MNASLPTVIRNPWVRDATGFLLVASILDHRTCPEGLDVERVRFLADGSFALDAEVGHLVSVLAGEATLCRAMGERESLHLSVTTHVYVPAGWRGQVEATEGAEIVHVASATAAQARGERLLVRDEEFLVACASESESLRWILTSQYLSRRIFLEHDMTLLSRSGEPVSWYRTTMFDVTGLPANDDGEPVFMMEYDSRTEFNVCYDVEGDARVRMARHPYTDTEQGWRPWQVLDSDSTYHVNEGVGGNEPEIRFDPATGDRRILRNKHEVYIRNGYVTLFCLFDPAPAGFERHSPGSYSDYEPLAAVLGTERHATYRRHLEPFDEMVDVLSLAQARGELAALRGSPAWRLYVRGRHTQAVHDAGLVELLRSDGGGRDLVVGPWAVADLAAAAQPGDRP